ncbi:DUF1207 domain-containing protein [Skermanella mucosa]|uniref:DUF1207 domain-containing protein n=1 Tax=Skermanella mucosa TaxID=1789672 RepID=UPI00192AB3E8|nr:DUF1207 domain-containing protein [Skermanella mucosa]UEM21533.1 DUF1207 domain-containing protein [Skermanella mucosa]
MIPSHIRRHGLASAVCLVLSGTAGLTAASAQAPDDAFIAGYAAAIVQREFGLAASQVTVSGGVIQVDAEALASSAGPRLRTALAEIPGVTDVRVREAAVPPASAPGPVLAQPPAAASAAPATAVVAQGAEILPRNNLFEPLIADPRWPRFSASYRYYLDDPDVEHAGAVSFGETFPLYRNSLFGGRWEIGFQAAVFSVFDLNSDSMDLVNADYWVGVPVSWRRGDFSVLGRIFHQSSHLGDEYLLREEIDRSRRINLSYEAVEGLASYDINDEFRVYGGVSYLFDQEPSDLEPWGTQAGVEYESRDTYAGGLLRPVAAVDMKFREEADWDMDLSLQAGFQLESSFLAPRNIRLLAEYYNGSNPNGQFYSRKLEYIGIGINVQLD